MLRAIRGWLGDGTVGSDSRGLGTRELTVEETMEIRMEIKENLNPHSTLGLYRSAWLIQKRRPGLIYA